MKQTLMQRNYAVFYLEIDKHETDHSSIGDVIGYLKQKIETHDTARLIAVFDHFNHTEALPHGHIGEEILAAFNIVFCFGITLPDPQIMAERPRSIGIAELEQSFIISFLEAPMPLANNTMESWAKSLYNGSRVTC